MSTTRQSQDFPPGYDAKGRPIQPRRSAEYRALLARGDLSETRGRNGVAIRCGWCNRSWRKFRFEGTGATTANRLAACAHVLVDHAPDRKRPDVDP